MAGLFELIMLQKAPEDLRQDSREVADQVQEVVHPALDSVEVISRLSDTDNLTSSINKVTDTVLDKTAGRTLDHKTSNRKCLRLWPAIVAF